MLGVIGQQCCVRLHAALSPVQTDATLLDVTCCVRFHTLLHVVPQMFLRVVAQSLKPVKLFSQQLPTFLLFCDRRSVAHQYIHTSLLPPQRGMDPFALPTLLGHARSLRMEYKDLWVVFFPRCTAGPKLVGSYCIRLHTTANTQATML